MFTFNFFVVVMTDFYIISNCTLHTVFEADALHIMRTSHMKFVKCTVHCTYNHISYSIWKEPCPAGITPVRLLENITFCKFYNKCCESGSKSGRTRIWIPPCSDARLNYKRIDSKLNTIKFNLKNVYKRL